MSRPLEVGNPRLENRAPSWSPEFGVSCSTPFKSVSLAFEQLAGVPAPPVTVRHAALVPDGTVGSSTAPVAECTPGT